MDGISVDMKLAIAFFQDLEKRVFQKVMATVDKWGKIIETDSKENAPVDRGQLKASINEKLWVEASQIMSVVGTNKFYGYYQHEGFKPHWIPFYNPPTWGKESGERYPDVIKWARRHGFDVDGVKDPKTGKWIKKPMKGIFVKGIANPYMKKAWDKNIDSFRKELEYVVQKAVEELHE